MASAPEKEVQHRLQVVEEINLVRSGLLQEEFEWSLLSSQDEQLWTTALENPSPPADLLLTLPLPDFSLSLSEASPTIHLSAQYHSFTLLPTLAIHAKSLSRGDQSALNEQLGQFINSAEEAVEHQEHPLFAIFTAMREYITCNPPSLPLPAPNPPPNSSSSAAEPRQLKVRTTLLWSHHLLATGKRKSILSWASELQLWGISKPGYPGVIIIEGLVEGVEEFVRRIKQLNWKALQVRCEVDGYSLSPGGGGGGEGEAMGEKERVEWVLREKSCLGRVLGGEREGEGKIGVREVAELGQVGDLMTKAGLEEVFRTAMKL